MRLISASVLLSASLGLLQHASAQQYPFLPIPGTPKSVQRLFEDSRGRLWLLGEELACYDGSRVFYLRDYGFPSVRTYEIAEDQGGAIWIGAESGIYRFFRGRVEFIDKSIAISLIPIDAATVIAATAPFGPVPENTTLVRIRKRANSWQVESLASLESPGPLTLDSSHVLLYPWPTKGWNELRVADVLGARPGAPLPVIHHAIAGAPGNGGLKVLRDRQGCIWFGAPRGNAYDCGHGFQAAPFPNANVSAAIHEAPNGEMVLSGNTLVAVGRPGSFRVATRANGLPGILDAIAGRDGTVWLGATTGLYRFPYPFRIEYWTIREGIPDPPWSLTRSGDRMYAGLDHRIVRLSADRERWETFVNFDAGGLVSSLLAASDGGLFASFIDAGAGQLRPDGSIAARTLPGRPKCCSMRLANAADGELWLGGSTLDRVVRSGSTLTLEEHSVATHPSKNFLAIKYDSVNRRLWSCYNGGLVLRDDRGWREISAPDGLPAGGCWSLVPLPNGDVWYAHFGVRALSRIRFDAAGNPQIRQYRDDIPEPGNASLDADSAGRLWRAADLGIYVASATQAEAGQWLRLDQSDGFPANGMNSGSVFPDSDGSLWWGADNDLAHFSPPPDLVEANRAPHVFVSAFSWDGATPRLAEAVEGVPPGKAAVAHLGSLQFAERNGLRVRYRLLPGRGWQEATSLDLPLAGLASGAHTLEFQAGLRGGPWSPVTAARFQILTPPYRTWPLLLVYFSIALASAAVALVLYRRRAADAAQLLPDLANWRMGALLPETHELHGAVLDSRFEVGDVVARGGFATVMLGFDRRQNAPCAIKVFRRELSGPDGVQRTFRQEVAALEKIRHPNVVAIYAHGVEPSGAPYLVMEYIEGRSLREILEAGPLSPPRTAMFLRHLAGALTAIHEQQICHRDVKPENIIIRHDGTPGEQAVLIDFSIAIVKDADETLHGISRAAGTFDYMGPEQAIGYAEPSSDVYSLAKTLIEMLTGKRLKQLLPEAALDLPDRVRELAGSFPVRFSATSIDMLAAALEFDPARRPRSAGAFAEPVLKDLEGGAISHRTAPG